MSTVQLLQLLTAAELTHTAPSQRTAPQNVAAAAAAQPHWRLVGL